ncbi:TraR/DksA family transcriptional regulator [Actinomadura sp. DC4]|uniref:TraR/DksA family transcriptional regulator n=1 Tax=Actinomadura sp. DC4 TaxID=3055069 RepID=UPI0025B02A7E|nr:TraR/DksA family transcriptional regulator [Actinomadura sp. DC4]MDN3357033.1 TraR/DksA family transcriptional regulator [Actinomadura sp. DC4]
MGPDTARKRLDEMLAGLDRSIAVLHEEHPEAEHHTSDAGASLSDTDRIDAALDALRRQRTEVLAALTRNQEGTYGKCVDCGLPVPEARLEARPEASRCVTCQSKRDRSHR